MITHRFKLIMIGQMSICYWFMSQWWISISFPFISSVLNCRSFCTLNHVIWICIIICFIRMLLMIMIYNIYTLYVADVLFCITKFAIGVYNFEQNCIGMHKYTNKFRVFSFFFCKERSLTIILWLYYNYHMINKSTCKEETWNC